MLEIEIKINLNRDRTYYKTPVFNVKNQFKKYPQPSKIPNQNKPGIKVFIKSVLLFFNLAISTTLSVACSNFAPIYSNLS